MGVVIPFEKDRALSKKSDAESVLRELSDKNIVFDVDPDLVEALGLVREIALSVIDAERGDVEFSVGEDDGEGEG